MGTTLDHKPQIVASIFFSYNPYGPLYTPNFGELRVYGLRSWGLSKQVNNGDHWGYYMAFSGY